jgi:N-hydroxyarylamine O-acetyltransferase
VWRSAAGQTLRILADGDYLVMMQREGEGEWKAQYRFTLRPYSYADYAEMCIYHQTSPQSHFTMSRVCSLATSGGRVTLSGMRLIITSEEGAFI